MAWNQPSGPNNPWGRRPGQSGPDLDERLKSWQRKLESLLRPGGRGGESGSLLLTVALVALALWLASGFFQVKAAERGVILRFGKLVDVKNQGWGWRWPWPIETLTKVNVASVNSSDYKRSEEHTSELQSRLHLVCRLLLEKKKKKQKQIHD